MRKIIHIDADSFYASVEIRDNPSLQHLPVAVGGSPDKRGVIATCNYNARAFGVRSAMSSAKAVLLCPDLVFIRPRFEVYRSVSKDIHKIFRDYTDLIEPLSLDEAYLDVSDCKACKGSATLIAEEIRARVKQDLRLTVSAGVAPNKFLAKIASDWNKPDGIFVIRPQEVKDFIPTLPVRKINGVGKVTAAKMEGLGITTCGDLQRLSKDDLERYFGSYGERLYNLSRGVDNRPVQTEWVRKSLSVEHTYDHDLQNLDAILDSCEPLFEELLERFNRISDAYLVNKRFVKVKFADFTQTTLEELLPGYSCQWRSLPDYLRLMSAAWARQKKPVRLLGMGVRLKDPKNNNIGEQLSLF
ncbi:DNA polymerase IV [Hahella sp. KA22]|uniref:DNA polymerase IV n=1 Tax=Hahella sp. KA22 TaxID=1628392 RepID=UPI000FDDD0B6|nr:DNA polymerase IV [Hahella sp. KA22]AZZ93210.1 DNA polymerase IV [Hahella sp. KA22]QAY56584.1 DNA polymerase IV [Hahella sp. KA22]